MQAVERAEAAEAATERAAAQAAALQAEVEHLSSKVEAAEAAACSAAAEADALRQDMEQLHKLADASQEAGATAQATASEAAALRAELDQLRRQVEASQDRHQAAMVHAEAQDQSAIRPTASEGACRVLALREDSCAEAADAGAPEAAGVRELADAQLEMGARNADAKTSHALSKAAQGHNQVHAASSLCRLQNMGAR